MLLHVMDLEYKALSHSSYGQLQEPLADVMETEQP